MPEDTKKKHQKGKNDPKEQRRPRQRHQAEQPVQKPDNKSEETKVSQKPTSEEPGPEFYKNLKRETDEILKITEEENSKYKKKEIQSNWSKYEMPIESYEEIDEQESLGADYEKLIAEPLSVGGHFQFKHEKSWDQDIGPNPYDRYFHINMEKLFLAISTVPFYDRNDVPNDLFTESEIANMNNKANRSKHKYHDENSFTSPELEAQNKTLNILKDLLITSENNETEFVTETDSLSESHSEECLVVKDTTLQDSSKDHEASMKCDTKNYAISVKTDNRKSNEEFDIIYNFTSSTAQENLDTDINVEKICSAVSDTTPSNVGPSIAMSGIESSDDLEKWLDDFLDK